MPVGVLTMLVSRGRMLLGFIMLAMRVVVRGLEMVVRGRVMASRSLVMMLNRRVFVLFGHGGLLLQRKVEGLETTVVCMEFGHIRVAGPLTRQVPSRCSRWRP
jgi:hypothetical protein